MSLYRTYRPVSFADIAGQEHIKQTLQNEIAGDSLVHAYIFSGPRAVGKTTTARVLTRAINCLNRKAGTSEPCNECDACVAIRDNRTLDVIEIDAASNRGIDMVRDNIISAARVGRAGLAWKVFIIDEVHMMTTEAFNALLKVLEEPPSFVMFILATTELHKVPATVVSRCQRFDFKKIAPDAMRVRLERICILEGKKVEQSVLDSIIRLSSGYLRDAESLLGQVLSLDEKNIDVKKAAIVLPLGSLELVKKFIASLIAKDAKGALHALDSAIDGGIDLGVLCADILEFLRTLLLIKAGAQDLVAESENEIQERETLCAPLSEGDILSILEYLLAAQRDMRYSSLPQLPLEIALAKMCGVIQPSS
ncbi:MAG: DNA polymerase III subunit gamma/tau [Candidatus Uhrbacteria bacterium]|nr:DNA polymerase III subunit gamma/tau [Candidatus Uhrbacteria bacterium]